MKRKYISKLIISGATIFIIFVALIIAGIVLKYGITT